MNKPKNINFYLIDYKIVTLYSSNIFKEQRQIFKKKIMYANCLQQKIRYGCIVLSYEIENAFLLLLRS